MASELQNLLRGAGEAKAVLFATEDFAGDHAGSIVGRVKRRRAVRAATVGGASALGVGVFAVAGMNVPRISAGLGIAPASGTVVCTTTTAGPEWAPKVFTFTDPADGSSADVAVSADGTTELQTSNASLEINDTGDYVLTLANGSHATITFVTLAMVPPEGTNPSDLIGAGFRDGSFDVTEKPGPAITPLPVAHCVTTTPGPSEFPSSSPTATPSGTASALPSGSPAPGLVDDFGIPTSPFQCGYAFDEPVQDSDGLSIEGLAWLTAEEAEQAILANNGGWLTGLEHPQEAVLSASAEFAGAGGIELPGNGERNTADPRDSLPSLPTHPGRYFYTGLTVVGVSDGKVSATVPVDSVTNAWLYGDSLPEATTFGIAMLDDDEALISCSGPDEWDSVYVVAGIGIADVNGWVLDPVYAWAEVPSAT